MSNLYDEFEEKFKFSWFSCGWVEKEVKQPEPQKMHIRLPNKDLETLECELKAIEEDIENIAQKQLRLANLAKFYQ